MDLKLLRVVGFIEGLSYLLILFVTMPLKYMYGHPEPNRWIGMIHGVLFVGYCVLVLYVASRMKWSFKIQFWCLLASIIPFGTFWADRKYFSISNFE